jgi:hypothetical protein
MFKLRRSVKQNQEMHLPPPVAGLNAIAPLMGMSPRYSVLMENFFPEPDGLTTRDGYVEHVTGFAEPVKRLHTYSASTGAESLWATTDDGVFDATTAGAVGAAAIVLTDGETISTSIATGAGTYMMLVNGVDTLKQYNGTTWSSIATFGATASETYSYIETYRQRIFFAVRDSLQIEYLAPNAISGAATNYDLGAIFRRGGKIVALATWTVDSGTGPDDNLAVLTSTGEVAVFAGSDPTTWSLGGVYYVGKPLGSMPVFKYGGDLLLLLETGLYPLSLALQSTSIERRATVTQNVKPLLIYAAQAYGADYGWQIISDPIRPYLLVNIPFSPVPKQLVMHGQTGSWAFFSGYSALSFGRLNAEIVFGTATTVCRVTGVSDAGANIVATMIQAPTKMGAPRNARIELIKPYFSASGQFTVALGVASDFQFVPDYSSSSSFLSSIAGAIWGTGVWGTSVWTGSIQSVSEWRAIPDRHSPWKGLYLQITGNISRVKYLGSDILYSTGGNF